MLKVEGNISDAVIRNMLSWCHKGCKAYCGLTIPHNNDHGHEDLACNFIRACFSQGHMIYIAAADTLDGQAKLIY